MKFCCDQFKGNCEIAGNRGFGVFSIANGRDDPAFIIQHRALEPNGEPPPHAPSPISLVSEMRITYCPWCGKKLRSVYKSNTIIMRPDLKI